MQYNLWFDGDILNALISLGLAADRNASKGLQVGYILQGKSVWHMRYALMEMSNSYKRELTIGKNERDNEIMSLREFPAISICSREIPFEQSFGVNAPTSL